MPNVVWEVTGLTDRTAVIGARTTEGGHLFSLSALIQRGNTQTGRTHVQVAIFSGAPTLDHIITVLLDDYVYDGHSPTWTGKLPMEESESLMGIVRSADGVTVRFTGRTLKHDP